MRIAFGLTLISIAATGCAVGFSAVAGPTLETTGHVGGEAMVDVYDAVGNEDFRLGVRLGAGGGYLGASQAGYGLLQPGVSVELGERIVGTLDTFCSLRLLHDTETRLRVGGGIAFQALFPVAETGGENAHVSIGPRLGLEYIAGEDDEPNRGLLSLSLTVRWITFDTTSARWF